MPRKMILRMSDGEAPVLAETEADDETQLQELVKDNPDLLPIEEFGMTGPVMVVGRETSLPSGAADLVVLARSGELVIVEFKTGPQNQDFRRALAQLLDYGSDMWRMSYDEFERTVAVRYFASDHCRDARFQGLASLEQAVKAIWDLPLEEVEQLRERLIQQLTTGSFHYVLVAQGFTETIKQTVEYLNAITRSAQFYALEIVQFTGAGLSAFESRSVLQPARMASTRSSATLTSEAEFLDGISDQGYRESLRELLEACRGLGLRFEWGSLGASIRVQTPDRPEPLTIAWLFPPGRSGWMGLKDLTLGFDRWSANQVPSVRGALEQYLEAAKSLPGVEPSGTKTVQGARLAPEPAMKLQKELVEILADLVRRVNEGQ